MAKYISHDIYENIKHLIFQKPPLALFLLSIGILALVFMSLGYYIRANEISSHNISKNWNVFLENISQLDFCLVNKTSPSGSTTAANKSNITRKHSELFDIQPPPLFYDQSLNNSDIENISIALIVTIHPTVDFVNGLQNATLLSGFLHTHDLGIINEDIMGISVYLPNNWNSSNCYNPIHNKCEPINIYTCVYLYARANLFPSTKRPSSCQLLESIDMMMPSKIDIISHKNRYDHKFRCLSRTNLKIQHKLDQSLNIMLSIEDRSLINLHLMHTSYFLLVMAATVFIYSIIKAVPFKLSKPSSSVRIDI